MLKLNIFGWKRVLPHFNLTGKVFAIRLSPDRWGFIRFRHGSGFGFLPVYSTRAGMPRIDWNDSMEKWFADADSGSDPHESDDYPLVGKRPPVSIWMPDRFQRPRYPWDHWIIFRRDELVRVNGPEDVAGLEEAVYLNPVQITNFLRQKYEAGELKPVEVDPPEPCPADPAAEQAEREAPTIVFAKIVQPIGPAEREQIYEEPLGEFLAEHELGLITGGGTMQDKDGSVLFAGIDMEVDDVARAVPLIAVKLAELGAPEGSVLEYVIDDAPIVYPIRSRRG